MDDRSAGTVRDSVESEAQGKNRRAAEATAVPHSEFPRVASGGAPFGF